MNTRLIRTTLALLVAAAFAGAGCEAVPTAGGGWLRSTSPLEKQYIETIDRLLPGMGAEKIVDRKEAQLELERMCFDASAPGKPAERAALIVSYVLDAFDLYIEGSPQRERMVGLAFSQIDCASPKTRKRAKQFLDRWG